MKIKFNMFERVAGLFVLAAIMGGIASTVAVAYRKGWFSTKIPLRATFSSAEGIHVGTEVRMAGLRVGEVTEVELRNDNSIDVEFVVMDKFHGKVRSDSVVRVIRPFIIGEKVFDVTVGSDTARRVAHNQRIPVQSSMDIMDLLSGRELGTYLDSMAKLTDNLRILMDAFSDGKRFTALVEVLDEIKPLVSNLNGMSVRVMGLSDQLTAKKNIGRVMNNLADLTDEVHAHMPAIAANAPKVGTDLVKTLENLTVLTKELQVVLPALATVAPQLPAASLRMVEAVDEAVITLKALQKSFMMSGNVEEVKEEEAQREKQPDSKRVPTNEQ